MTTRDLARLVVLAAAWGIAFVFIRVAVPAFGPFALTEARVLIAGIVLALYAAHVGAPLDLRRNWKLYLAVGFFNSTGPFVLIAAAQTVLSASWAVVLVATTPLQTAIIAALAKLEPLTARKVVGSLLAVTGVGVLVGLDAGVAPPPWAVLCALFAGTMYGIAGVITRRHAEGLPGVSMAAGTMLAAAALLAPFAVAFPPPGLPSWTAVAAMLALALVSTAAAFVLYFRFIMSIGPVKALTVNFLSPIFGVSAGILVLGERLTSSLVAGAALILCGLALVLGSRR